MPDTTAIEASLSTFLSIPIYQIKPSTHQARKDFDEEDIKGLAESMKQEGLIEPIVVRPIGDRKEEIGVTNDTTPKSSRLSPNYELISGERRLRAAKLLGWAAIEAKVIQTVSEGESAAKGLIENLQREDLNPIEEAEGINALLDLHDGHWTQEQIGKVCGKPQSRVSESLRLLSLPDAIQGNIRQRIMTREHGIEILRLNNANSQKGMANKIVKGGWSVKKT